MTYTQALDALATMYRYQAMYKKFADLYKHDDPEQAKVYAKLARLGTKKIKQAEAHTLTLAPVDALGLTDQLGIIETALKARAEGERNALTEYFQF